MWKALAAIAAMVSLTAGASTKILFSFDTEDYTCDRSNDAIRDIANVLRAEGVRGNFNIVGYLATRLVELGRFDVIDALRGHVIGSQTLYHSRHPDIAEIGDDTDYARAYRLTLADEARALGMLEATFGEGRCVFWCPPGNCVSAVAMDVYSDLGVVFSGGCGMTDDKASALYAGCWCVPDRPSADFGILTSTTFRTPLTFTSSRCCRKAISPARTSTWHWIDYLAMTSCASICIRTWPSRRSIGTDSTTAREISSSGVGGRKRRIVALRIPRSSTIVCARSYVR